jgi:hypothetical protein
MVPRKEKKQNPSQQMEDQESKNPNSDLFSDTSYKLHSRRKTWYDIFNIFEEEKSVQQQGTILSDNLYRHIENFLNLKVEGQSPPFYMSSYIMDAIFFHTYFPQMGWQWTPSSAEPIHIYHSKLWEENAKEHFYEIFIMLLFLFTKHSLVFYHPRITEKYMHNLDQIGDWYIEETFSYIRVYGCNAPPHALPKFMPDRLVCREIAYQTAITSITK